MTKTRDEIRSSGGRAELKAFFNEPHEAFEAGIVSGKADAHEEGADHVGEGQRQSIVQT